MYYTSFDLVISSSPTLIGSMIVTIGIIIIKITLIMLPRITINRMLTAVYQAASSFLIKISM
jgi:hypothetical protein